MSTEVAVYQPREVARADSAALAGSVTDSWVLVVADIVQLAQHICRTEFVPRNYRNNAPATAAAILAGRELNLPPMTALRHVHVVEGSPSLSAEYKRARVLAAGHDFDILELSITRCVVSGQRKEKRDRPPLVITFTIEDARRAKLVKANGAYETRPRRMLFARASTELCDFMFADVTNGLPTTELLGEADGDDELAGYNESPGQALPAPAAIDPPRPRTAQRRTRQAAAEKVPDLPHAAAAPAATAPDPDAPPFPGDEQPAVGEPDHDSPGTATVGKGGQLTALWTILRTEFGFTDDEKAQARSVCEQIIGRRLAGETTGDLSYNEARTVLDTLANWKSIAESDGNVEPREVMMTHLAKIAELRDASGDGAAGQAAAERAFKAGEAGG